MTFLWSWVPLPMAEWFPSSPWDSLRFNKGDIIGNVISGVIGDVDERQLTANRQQLQA